MATKFVPQETFEAIVRGQTNRYLRGQQYTVYDTPDHADLAAKVDKWERDGLVVTAPAPGSALPVRVTVPGQGS